MRQPTPSRGAAFARPQQDMSTRKLQLIFVGVALVAACGSDAPPPPECTGTSCACPADATCDIGDSGCSGESCTLACTDHNECSGECGESCSISCSNQSSCDVTVGPSGSVSCADSSCTVRCTGSCSLSCGAGSTCEIQCAGDAAPRAVTEGASCP